MSAPTVRENSSLNGEATEAYIARETFLEQGRHVVFGAATLLERTGHTRFSHISAAAPTIRWGGETAEPGDEHVDLSERYRIRSRLCTGAEAQLFVAERVYDNEQVILKIYHDGISPAPGVLERVALCSAEHVVSLHEHGFSEGHFFEVQEYVSDATLQHLLASHQIDEVNARLILRQVAAALAHLHTPDTEGRFIVHRDIKPANILIRPDATTLDLVLCDFGIAALTGCEEDSGSGSRDCTPMYASPETFAGIVTPKADYWSLGVVLLEALEGRHPFYKIPDDQIEVRLRNGLRPDTTAVQSPEWKELIIGLTQPNHEERWGCEEVERWLGTETIHEEETEAEAAEDFVDSFDYLKAGSLQELAGRLVLNWQCVSPLLDDRLFRIHLAAALDRLAPGRTVAGLLDDEEKPNDIRLLRLIYRLCPDFPHFWKEWIIHDPKLVEICRNAAAGDGRLQELVGELDALQVLKELAVATGDEELAYRASSWQRVVSEYTQTKERMERLGAPVDLFPAHGRAVAMLYLLACNDGVGMVLNDGEVTQRLLFSFPWLSPLKGQPPLTAAQRLLRSLVLPHCMDLESENFLVSHGDIADAIQIESRPAFEMGWNPPTIAMSAVHMDLEMTICQRKKTIARGVRLTWDVRRAAIIYLSRFGFVRSSGTRPDERMFRGGVFPFVDSCSCENHAENWFTVTETTVFSLVAIGPGGISVHRLPPIVVPPPVLEPMATLSVPMPVLLPRAELTVTIPQLLGRMQLAAPLGFSVPAMTAKDFAVEAMRADDLLPQAELNVVPLAREDLLPQASFSRKSDDQIRYAKENRLL